MSRNVKDEMLYTTFQNYLSECLLKDGSIFWASKNIWTKENLYEFKNRFIDNPDFSDKSFSQKISIQLQNGAKDLWGLLGELFFIYYLPPRKVRYELKIKNIEEQINRSGYPVPVDDTVWEPLKSGFCSTGQQYNLKYREFYFILSFALALKEASNPSQIILDREKFQKLAKKTIDSMEPKNRGYDMYSAFLYLTFPDYYEPIISLGAKNEIVEKLSLKLDKTFEGDVDDKLFQIRGNLLSTKPDLGNFSFYEPAIKDLWKNQPIDKVKKLKKVIRKIVNAEDDEVAEALSILQFTRNLIIYGPPGTGKTYVANKIARKLVASQMEGQTKEAKFLKIVENLRFFDVLALSMYTEGKENAFTVSDIRQHELIRARNHYLNVQHDNENTWSALQFHTNPECPNVHVQKRSEPFLFYKNDNSQWSLSKTGIEYVEENLIDSLAELKAKPRQQEYSDFIEWITFHQSYSYEEFIEGLRPVTSETEQEEISVKVIPGIFRVICQRAAVQKDKNFVMVIDEINRGNISKIFGELITLIEDDKRNVEYQVSLPYSKEKFSVPQNLFVLGTMNSTDRSIALLDIALRRRFSFLEIKPQPNLLKNTEVSYGTESVNLGKLLTGLNKNITKLIDSDHTIGHSYFLNIINFDGEPMDALEFVWNYQILPLLEEYFSSQPEKIRDILNPYFSDEDIVIDYHHIKRETKEDLLVILNQIASDEIEE